MLPSLPATADLSDRTKLKMTGADRVRYLNGQVTNDVTTLAQPGDSVYACVTNAKGKLEADVVITELGTGEDAFLIDADPSLREDLFARLDKYVIADDVQIEDITGSLALFHVIKGDPDVSGLPKLSSVSPLLTSPSNRFGIPGTDLILAADRRDVVLAELPPPIDRDSLEYLRIAHGIPKWGAELTPDILPPEAGLQERAISYTKGCYIGQEVISRIKSVGRVNKHLVALTIAANFSETSRETVLRGGLTLYTDNPEKPVSVGILTSFSLNPTLGPTIGLGFAKTNHIAPETLLYAGTDADPHAFPFRIGKTPLI